VFSAYVTATGQSWADCLDQSQIRSFEGICRHTALAALAQLRHVAIRGALHGKITLPPVHAGEADLVIPLGDAPVPARGGQPCPRGIGHIKLSVAETARLTRLASQYTSGLMNRTRLAFALRWSARRRRHQAAARWHHYSARLAAVAT